MALYQQGVQRIEVIVKREGSGGQQGAKETEPEKATANGGEETDTTQGTTWKRKRFIKTNVTHAFSVVKQVADYHIDYAISGIGMKNGDEALQDRVQRQYEVVKDVSNVATSIAMGATYGSAGGPVGAALGAVFGAVSSVTTTAFKYADRQREYDFKMFKINNSIEYKKARANINLTTGRLR